MSLKSFDQFVEFVEDFKNLDTDNHSPISKELHKLIERVNKIESTLSQLIDKIGEMANHYYREREELLKCPVCNGGGTVKHVMGISISDCGQDNKCPKCHGEGFLWL